MRTRNPNQTREKLLLAAASLIAQQGAAKLKLETVAEQAQVSKGGLLHHFPSKQALFAGLMEQVSQVFSQRFEHHLAKEPAGQAGRRARAYIHASFEYDPHELQLTNALASAVTVHPELLEQLRQAFVWVDAQLQDDGLSQARSTTLRLACDGLWLAELLEFSGLQEPARSELRAELIALTRAGGQT